MGDTSDELEERVRTIARKQAELDREQQELRVEAEQQLARIEFEIAKLEEQLRPLYEKRDKVKTLAGLRSNTDSEGVRRGELKDACLAALRTGHDGMTSHGVKGWIARNFVGLRTDSVPAVLSRALKQGIVRKDADRKYSLV